MKEANALFEKREDGTAGLGALLRELGLTHEAVAQMLGVSKDAVDNWSSGRSNANLAKLSLLIRLLEERGAEPERLRALLVGSIVGLGLDNDLAGDYLGLRRLPCRYEAYAVVVHDLRSEGHVAAVTEIRDAMLRAGREAVVLDCCGEPLIRRFYLEELVPSLAPAGLILCRSLWGVDLDAPAARLARLGIPTVYLAGRPRVLARNAAFVGWDDRELGYIAGRAIAQAGYDDIAVITYDGAKAHALRKQGFDRALAAFAPPTTRTRTLVAPMRGDTFLDAELVGDLLRFLSAHRPQVVFLASSALPLTFIHAVTSTGGEHLDTLPCVTIGYGGWTSTLLSGLRRPAFTIVQAPVRAAARKAFETVLRLSGDEPLPLEERTITIPCIDQAVDVVAGGDA